MKDRQRWPNVRVPNRSQPPAFRCLDVVFKVHSNSLDEQDIREARDDRLCASATRVQLFQDLCNRSLQPRGCSSVTTLHVDQRGEYCEKRIGFGILKLHTAAHELGAGAAAPSTKQSSFIGPIALDKLEEIDDRSRPRVTQDMRIAAGHEHKVSCRQLDRLRDTFHFQQAVPLNNNVKYRAVVGKLETPWRL